MMIISIKVMIDPHYYSLMFRFILISAPWSTISSSLLLPQYTVIRYVNQAVMIASICYWFHPINGWRRQIDMLLVAIAAILHYELAYSVHRIWMMCLISCHCFFFFSSWVLHWNGYTLSTVIAWMGLHLVVHGGNMITYLLVSS